MERFLNKVDPYLFNMVKTCNKGGNISCIIYARDYERVKNFLKDKGIKVLNFFEYPFINAFGVKILPEKINALARNEQITYISASTRVFAQIDIAKQVTHIANLQNKGYLGKGVTMAIIDTGIKPHLDFVCPNNRIIFLKILLKTIKSLMMIMVTVLLLRGLPQEAD